MTPRVAHATLATCASATGTVVVIDVIRAFTTAAIAFDRGATDVVTVAGVKEALELRRAFPGSCAMGEVGGFPVPEFDFGNSPAAMESADVLGRRLIQRTSSGTQGLVLCEGADAVMAASFVVAGATLRALRASRASQVTFVATGVRADNPGDEDIACAEYLAAHLMGEPVSVEPYLERVRQSVSAQQFYAPNQRDFDRRDIDLCAELNRFEFAMVVQREAGLLVLKPQSA